MPCEDHDIESPTQKSPVAPQDAKANAYPNIYHLFNTCPNANTPNYQLHGYGDFPLE